MSSFTLTPAYGRDYKTKAEALADFNANKDFMNQSFMSSGSYVNKQDIPAGSTVNIRYKRMTQVLVVTV